jgi:hypothetical protein
MLAAKTKKPGDLIAARNDLILAFKIIKQGRMRLVEADWNIESAWLAIAEKGKVKKARRDNRWEVGRSAKEHLKEVDALFQQTGYRLREEALQKLREVVAKTEKKR